MEAYGLEPQVVLTTPLLALLGRGEDELVASATTSRSPQPPEEQFGRAMRIPDEMLEDWWGLVAEQPVPAGRADGGEARARAVRSCGARTARSAAAEAEAHFTRVVREGGAPAEVPEHALPAGDPVHLPAVIAAAFGLSTSEARRMIAQGGVKLDGAAGRGARPARARSSPGRCCRRASGASRRLADPAA